MTAPNGVTSGPLAGQRPAAAPPNPKQQAVTFALELAKIRASAGVAADRVTDVAQLISDAEAISRFIGVS